MSILDQLAELAFPAMGALEQTVTVDVYRKHGSVPLGRKGAGAQGAPIRFGCDV